MRWTEATVLFFIYVAAVAVVRPRVPLRSRLFALGGAAAGLGTAWWGEASDTAFLRFGVLPTAALLLSYWATGCIWAGPMPRIERILVAFDRRARIPALSAAAPRAVVELLEFAYAGVYPLIPIALLLHLAYAASPDADRFWTVILVTDYVCFGMLPWIQTRPPRAFDTAPPWRSAWRAFNERLLGHASIGVNTFPSGHAAEALAAALLVADLPWPIAGWMWFNAAAISGGAVFGRYHYALDALAGWAVALAVWAAIG